MLLKTFLNDKEFVEWLKKNKIVYNENDKNLMQALYGEFKIEQTTKK